jgi:hypothetical protein
MATDTFGQSDTQNLSIAVNAGKPDNGNNEGPGKGKDEGPGKGKN